MFIIVLNWCEAFTRLDYKLVITKEIKLDGEEFLIYGCIGNI